MVGFYASEDEAAAMMAAAKTEGKTLADWLRSLIPTDAPRRHPKSKSSAAAKKKSKSKKSAARPPA